MALTSIPREKIPWYPTIDTDVCTGDQECINFCKNNVFEWDEENGHPIVKNPFNCVVGCSACAKVCPVEAITFPTMQELRETVRQLREETSAS
jgi:NAD-dependent dihydropyrimidine dehydrogenase PreA subunit